MKTIPVRTQLKVADEVWIATVLLHREYPEDPDFTVDQIVQRAKQEGISRSFRPGVYVHAVQHCVANRPPNPGRYRMLFESAPGRRRLFRKGDSYHPGREKGKITPRREAMPHGYDGLIGWYENWTTARTAKASQTDPPLERVGAGKRLWPAEHADDYVRRLRDGWE